MILNGKVVNTLTTDRNGSGFSTTQELTISTNGEEAELDLTFGAGPDRVEVQFSHNNSPCWLGFRATRIKSGRRTADIMTSLDKSQIERLIENLKVLSERIDY